MTLLTDINLGSKIVIQVACKKAIKMFATFIICSHGMRIKIITLPVDHLLHFIFIRFFSLQIMPMSQQRFRQEEHIANLQFVVLGRFEESQTQLGDLISVLKLAIVQFRLQNYENALNYHLFAIGLTGSQQNIHLINTFLILDYLALGQTQEAVKLFFQYSKIQLGKPMNIFSLQVYCKLNLYKPFISVYNFVRVSEDGRDFHKIISCIWLIELYEKNGKKEVIKIAFEKSCRLLLEFKGIDCRNFYKLFQAAYFLLRYSYRTGRFDYRQRLKTKIWAYIDFIDKNLGPFIAKPLLNQLRAGKEYNICLLYVDS